MNLRPLHDWVVIKRDAAKTEENGFFITGFPSNQGVVQAVGPYVQGIEVGDRVQFNAYAGFVIRADELTVTMIRLDAILCLVEPEMVSNA